MFLSYEQDVTKRYFSFSQSSNGLAKMNLYLNIPVYSLISLSNIKFEKKDKYSIITVCCILI